MDQTDKIVRVWKQGTVYFVQPAEGQGRKFGLIGRAIDDLVRAQVLRRAEGVKATGAYAVLYTSPDIDPTDEEAICRQLEEVVQQQSNV